MRTYLMIFGLAAGLTSAAEAQTWQFTGPLNTGRDQETINVLQNGQVLVTGGNDPAGNALASCEIYDPASASWSYAASMNVPRAVHTSNELPDGRIVVIGGNSLNVYESIVTSSIEIYDPVANTWSDGGSLQLARQNHTATLLNDSLILVCGGYTGDITNECEIYNVNTHQSTVVQPMVQPRHEASAVMLADGTVLVAGGRTGGSVSDYLAECELYNPSTNSWSVLPSMLQPRGPGLLMRFSDNKVLAAGGRASIYATAPGAEVFDPSNTGWTSVSPILQPCCWTGATVLPGDRLLMTGGIISFDWTDPSGQTVTNTATCEWYDKPNERWYYAPTLNNTRSRHSAVTLTQNVNANLPTQMELVVGGMIGTSDVTNTCEVLDVGTSALTYYMAHQLSMASVAGTTNIDAIGLQIVYGTDGPVADLTLATGANTSTELVSIDGRIVLKTNEQLSAGDHQLAIPQSLTPGMYLLRVNADGKIMSMKVMISK